MRLQPKDLVVGVITIGSGLYLAFVRLDMLVGHLTFWDNLKEKVLPTWRDTILPLLTADNLALFCFLGGAASLLWIHFGAYLTDWIRAMLGLPPATREKSADLSLLATRADLNALEQKISFGLTAYREMETRAALDLVSTAEAKLKALVPPELRELPTYPHGNHYSGSELATYRRMRREAEVGRREAIERWSRMSKEKLDLFAMNIERSGLRPFGFFAEEFAKAEASVRSTPRLCLLKEGEPYGSDEMKEEWNVAQARLARSHELLSNLKGELTAKMLVLRGTSGDQKDRFIWHEITSDAIPELGADIP